MPSRELNVIITGDVRRIRAALGELGSDLDRTNRQTDDSSGKWAKWGRAAATGAAIGVTALVGFGAAAVNAGAKFEQQMDAVGAVSQATGVQMGALSEKALQLGRDTSFSATESGAAMEELVKAGLTVEQVLGGAADATVALAAAGGIELAEAATIGANALNAFNLEAEQMGHVADVIAGAANTSAIDVSEFGMSMQQASAVANLVGLSFEDTAAAIGLMGDAGIRGSDAGTSLKTMLTRLTPQTMQQSDAMRELGLLTEEGTSRFYDQEGSLRSLDDVAGILRSSLEGLSDEKLQQALYDIFGSDALRAGAILFGEGAAGVREFSSAMGEVAAADVAKDRLDNLLGSVERFKGAIESFLIESSGGLNERLRGLVDTGTAAVEWMSDPPTGLTDWAEATAGTISEQTAPAVEDLVQTGENLWDLLRNLASDGAPAVEFLAGLGGGAAAAGLRETADALETTTGFIADHHEAVIALAGAYVGMRAGALVLVGLERGATAIFAASTAAQQFTQNLWLMQSAAATSGGSVGRLPALLNATRTSLGKVGSTVMGSPLLAGGALVLGLYAITTAMTNANRQADELVDSLVEVDNPLDMTGMAASLRDVTAELDSQMDEWHRYDGVGGILKGTLEVLTPMENTVLDNARAVSKLREEEERLAGDMARIQEAAYTMGSTLGMSSEQVWSFMRSLELDPKTQSIDEMTGLIVEAATVASSSTPQTDALATSYTTLGDQAASATDKLSAYKDMVDAIFGVQMSAFEAQTSYGASFDALNESIAEHGRTLDWSTEAGRENRDALQGAADAALGWAESLADQGDLEGASSTLSVLREDLVNMATGLMGSRTAAEEFISSIGLSDDKLAQFAAGIAQPNEELAALQEYLDIVGGTVAEPGVVVDVDEAYKTMEGFGGDFAEWIAQEHPAVEARLETATAEERLEILDVMMSQYADSNPMAEAWLDSQPASVEFSALHGWAQQWAQAHPKATASIYVDESSAAAAQRRLDAITETRKMYVNIVPVGTDIGVSYGGGARNRWGGVYEFAGGGNTEAMALGAGPALYMWREPETGGEAFIPKNGNRARSLDIMGQVAGWLGVGIVDKKQQTYAMGSGGIVGGVSRRRIDFEDGSWVEVDAQGNRVASGTYPGSIAELGDLRQQQAAALGPVSSERVTATSGVGGGRATATSAASVPGGAGPTHITVISVLDGKAVGRSHSVYRGIAEQTKTDRTGR